jgi:hypothetical protein
MRKEGGASYEGMKSLLRAVLVFQTETETDIYK